MIQQHSTQHRNVGDVVYFRSGAYRVAATWPTRLHGVHTLGVSFVKLDD